jgi:DNA processing protein
MHSNAHNMALSASQQTSPLLHNSLMHEPLLDVLRLIRSDNVGAVTFHKLMRRYGSAAKALEAIPALVTKAGATTQITVCTKDKALQEIEKTSAFGATFVSYGSEYYPSPLAHIHDAPPLLVVQGHQHMLKSKPALAVVGSRNASANGRHYAKKLSEELGQAGFLIVSGLARGIDRYAHQGALASGTIGVIAGGIDHIYPPENADLYAAMKEQGAIISEAPFSAAPQHRHFPARNRIIAGMSIGTIIIEAAKKSGSLITAKYALEYNRDIFAVPGSPMDPRSEGGNHLIQQGATLVSSADDVINACDNHRLSVQDSTLPGLFFDIPASLDEDNLDAERQAVHILIDATPVTIEDIIVMSGVDARIVNVILLEMELAGMLRRHIGGTVSRNYEEE